MKLRSLQTYAALSIASAVVITLAVAQEKPAKKSDKPKEGSPPDMEEMMKKWEAASTPGAAHKVLESLVGEWNVDSRWWMAGPDGPPTESKGSNKTQWIFGKRFIQDEFTGEMMGQPFQGMGITGYDNLKKKYVAFWIDSMGTSMFTSEGTADAGGKVLTFLGKMDDPMTGEKDVPMKHIVRIESKDKHTFEMHCLSKGDKSKMGEITYTRK
jgi:hypothetical protein